MNKLITTRASDAVVWTVWLIIAFGLLINHDLAHGTPPANERLQAECGSCHVAYPPNLLPAPAWRRMMARLGKHFGSDASLDAGTAAEIAVFLERNAGTGKRGADSGTLRITETAWFKRKHDHVWYRRDRDTIVAVPIWTNARIQSAANCSACHPGAERGDFNERAVRIPR